MSDVHSAPLERVLLTDRVAEPQGGAACTSPSGGVPYEARLDVLHTHFLRELETEDEARVEADEQAFYENHLETVFDDFRAWRIDHAASLGLRLRDITEAAAEDAAEAEAGRSAEAYAERLAESLDESREDRAAELAEERAQAELDHEGVFCVVEGAW